MNLHRIMKKSFLVFFLFIAVTTLSHAQINKMMNGSKNGALESGARFNTFSGQVSVLQPSKSPDWAPAQKEKVLFGGDQVRTGEDSYAILNLANFATVVAKAKSEIILQPKKGNTMVVKLLAGTIMANVVKGSADEMVVIDMRYAELKITGATITLESAGEAIKLKVIEGSVSLMSKVSRKLVTVEAGQVSVANAQGISLPGRADLIAIEQTEWIRFEKIAAPNMPKPVKNIVQSAVAVKDAPTDFSFFWYLLPGIVLILGLTILVLRKRNKKKRTSPFPVSRDMQKNTLGNLCLQCGSPIQEQTKFCSKCGHPVLREVSNPEPPTIVTPQCKTCGAVINTGVKFCVSCGTAVSGNQPLSPSQPDQPVEQKKKPSGKVIEPRSIATSTNSRIWRKLLIAVGLLAIIGISLVLLLPMFTPDQEIRKKVLVENKINGESDHTLSYKDNIKVNVPYGLIDTEQKLSISSVTGIPQNISGLKLLDVYDVTITNTTTFDGFVEIVLKYNPALLPAGIKASNALTCLWFNEKNKTWNPIPFVIDEQKQQLTIYSPHLSVFAPGMITDKISRGPLMTIQTVLFPDGAIMEEGKVAEVLKSHSMSGGTKEGLIEGWNFVNEWFGVASATSSFVENVMEVGDLQGLNEIATEAGLGFALVQAVIDFSDGKKDKAVLELTKNLGNYSVGKYFNTTAINTAFVGIFAIDYSLNKFVTTAIEGRYALYQKAYDLYYKEKVANLKINSVWWYKNLKKVTKLPGKPSEANGAIENFLHDYAWEFWNDQTVIATYMEKVMPGHVNTGLGGLNQKLMDDISGNQLASIVHTLDEIQVFKRLMKELRMDSMSKLYDLLCRMQSGLNTEYPIKVVVRNDESNQKAKQQNLGNLNVRFVTSNPVHKEMWKGKTDKDGEMEFSCTALGYVDAGCPKRVEVEIPNPVAGKQPQILSGTMKLAGKGKLTIVEIKIGSQKLEGKWQVQRELVSSTLKNQEIPKNYERDYELNFGADWIKNWNIREEGSGYIITEPGFGKPGNGIYFEYRIQFNGLDALSGTMVVQAGNPENKLNFTISGTRKK